MRRVLKCDPILNLFPGEKKAFMTLKRKRCPIYRKVLAGIKYKYISAIKIRTTFKNVGLEFFFSKFSPESFHVFFAA